MKVEYYVTDATTGIPVWAEIRKATQFDYKKTVEEQWADKLAIRFHSDGLIGEVRA